MKALFYAARRQTLFLALVSIVFSPELSKGERVEFAGVCEVNASPGLGSYQATLNGVTVERNNINPCGYGAYATTTGVTEMEFGVSYSATLQVTVGYEFCDVEMTFAAPNLYCGGFYVNGQKQPFFYEFHYGGTGVDYYSFSLMLDYEKDIFRWSGDVQRYQGGNALIADGVSRAIPYTNGSFPSISWEIETNTPPYSSSLGCTIDPSTGVVTAGTNTGTILVRASEGTYCQEKTLDLIPCKPDCNTANCLQVKNGSVDVIVPLGWALRGGSAGYLSLHEDIPSSLIAQAVSLHYDFIKSDVEKITDAAGVIQQIKAPQMLANVVSNASDKFTIELYAISNVLAKVSGLYGVTNAPRETIVIENLNSDTNQVRVTRNNEDGAHAFDYQWNGSGWDLTSGNGLRTERKQLGWSDGGTLKTVTNIVWQGTNTPSEYRVDKLRYGSYGERLEQEIIGSGVNPITNNYSWTADGLISHYDKGNGSWAYYFYDSALRLTNLLTGFRNNPMSTNQGDARSIEMIYDSSVVSGSGDMARVEYSTPRRIIEFVEGVEVKRQYFYAKDEWRFYIQCSAPGDAWNASGNLTNAIRIATNGFYAEQPILIVHPDDTVEVFQYFPVFPSANRTNIVLKGKYSGNYSNVVDGVRIETLENPQGQILVQLTIDIVSGVVLDAIANAYDEMGRNTNTVFLDGTSIKTEYNCCGPSKVVQRNGVETDFTYDALNRMVTESRNGITLSNLYSPSGQILRTDRIPSSTNSSTITVFRNGFDDAGRLLSFTNALNEVTSYSYTNVSGGVQITATFPDTTTGIRTFFADGSIKEVSGTSFHPMNYDHGVVSDGGVNREFTLETFVGTGGDTNQWVKSIRDALGHLIKRQYAGSPTAEVTFQYNSKGQLWKVVDPDGVTRLFTNNVKGELEFAVLDLDQDGIIDWSGNDRITQTVTDAYTNALNYAVQRTRTWSWSTNGADVSNLVSTVEISADGLRSWNILHNGSYTLTNYSVTAYDPANAQVIVTNILADGSMTVLTNQNGRLIGTARRDSSGTLLELKAFEYDEHGRQNVVSDLRNGMTVLTFDDLDRVITITTPDSDGVGEQTQTITNNYNSIGQLALVSFADGGSLTNEYWNTGELKRRFGARAYPVEYRYDAQGRLTNMITWTNFVGGGLSNSTVWKYDPYRGFLTNKIDRPLPWGEVGDYFRYTLGGRLSFQSLLSPGSRTFNHGPGGDVVNIDHPALTAGGDQFFGYDRRGFQTVITNTLLVVTNPIEICTRTYGNLGELLTEAHSGGPLDGLTLSNAYDHLLRRTNVIVLNSNGAISSLYGFDGASRLSSISNASLSAEYGYLPNSPLVESIALRWGGSLRLASTNRFDYLNRLHGKSSVPSGASAASFGYAYNFANQRTAVTNADASVWSFAYDSRGQLTNGLKRWADTSLVAGQQFEYAYDDIGNRRWTRAGGNGSGGNLRQSVYTNTYYNELSGRGVPGYLDILGSAATNATVTVNYLPTERHGEYYRSELVVNNSSAPVWQSVTNMAVISPGGTNLDLVATNIGNVLIPKANEVYGVNSQGARGSSSLWNYLWDSESRLLLISSASAVPAAAKQTVTSLYDYRGRRTQKVVAEWNGMAYVPVRTNKFIYDDWNLIAELDGTNGFLRSYVWGSDLSGSMRGAGGVGGLLAMTAHQGANAGTYLYAYDGNGNVVGMADAASGEWVAEYEYEPFGKLLKATGPLAQENPFRFSTKYQDDETGHYYYGYRYYDPETGRWLSKDPIGEAGGINLYGFVGNDPILYFDALGLESKSLIQAFAEGQIHFGDLKNINLSAEESRAILFIYGRNDHIVSADQVKKDSTSGLDWINRINPFSLYNDLKERFPNIIDDNDLFQAEADRLNALKARLELFKQRGNDCDKRRLQFLGPATELTLMLSSLSVQLPIRVPSTGSPFRSNITGGNRYEPIAAERGLAGSIRNVNPTGGQVNCVNCAIAGEYTLRGAPASALPTTGPLRINLITKEFGGSFAPVSGPMEIGSILSRSGEGASGVVFGRGAGMNHVWNVVNQGGNIRFLDAHAGGLGVRNFEHFSDFQFLLTTPGR